MVPNNNHEISLQLNSLKIILRNKNYCIEYYSVSKWTLWFLDRNGLQWRSILQCWSQYSHWNSVLSTGTAGKNTMLTGAPVSTCPRAEYMWISKQFWKQVRLKQNVIAQLSPLHMLFQNLWTAHKSTVEQFQQVQCVSIDLFCPSEFTVAIQGQMKK